MGHNRTTVARHPGSRFLHAVDRWTAGPTLALVVVIAVTAFVVWSAVNGFPARPVIVFQTLVAATTLAMVFVIQHTQTRIQAATQRKLDEILRALPGADSSLMTLEEAPDRELDAAKDSHRNVRRDLPQAKP